MEHISDKPNENPSMEIDMQFFTPQLKPKPRAIFIPDQQSLMPMILKSPELPVKRLMSPRPHSLSISSAPMMHSLKKSRKKKYAHEFLINPKCKSPHKFALIPKVTLCKMHPHYK